MNDNKKSEIKYLEKRYRLKISNNISLTEYSKLKRKLFMSELENKKLTVTNNHDDDSIVKYSNKNINYKYSYLRFDSNIMYANFTKNFYNIKCNIKEKSFFTNCGMSAISAILLSLQNVLDDMTIIFPDEDIYFETYDFYNKYILHRETSKNRKIKIIYLDSICKKFNFKKYEKFLNVEKPSFIVFDTTCFTPKEIQKFINKIISKNVTCILIRSHTKLDMMATEISSLGSLSFILPNQLEQDMFNLIKKIISDFYYLLGKFGALCTPAMFPEFIFDKKFKNINFQRIYNLQKNNVCLYNEIKSLTVGSTILPAHKKFVLFISNSLIKSDDQRIDIVNKIKCFVKNVSDVNFACSFGFDYVAIDAYYDINEKNYVVRISMNDDCESKNIINQIKEFLNDNF